jgi:SNF2 family DNA or RNA helicase
MGIINLKIKRLNSKEYLDALGKIQKHFEQSDQIENSWDQLNFDIEKNFYDYKKDLLNNDLKRISLAALNKNGDGIRISALTNNGIYNLYDLSNYSESDLYQIRGIGPTNLSKIIWARNREINSVSNSLKVRINPEYKSYSSTKLILSLYKKIQNASVIKNVIKVKNSTHQKWKNLFIEAKKARNPFSWVFKSEQKQKEINSSINAIISLLSDPEYLTINQLFTTYFDHEGIESIEAWDHFSHNSIYYFSELERFHPLEYFQSNRTPLIKPVQPQEPIQYCNEEADYGVNVKPENFTGEKFHYLTQEKITEIEQTVVDLELFKSNLRSYQLFGVKFSIHSKKVLLGDEMGLGKTVEAIALLCHLTQVSQRKSHFLVIVPSSVLINWTKEVKKHSHLNVFKLHGREFHTEINSWKEKGGVAITTYGHIHKVSLVRELKYEAIVLDESHYIKNPNTKRTLTASKLIDKADNVLLMTGTPIENNLVEMNNMIGFLNEDLAYELQIDVQFYKPEIYRHKVANHYLRRNRKDVLLELPELTVSDEWIEFTSKEKDLYESAVVAGNFMLMRRIAFVGVENQLSSKMERLLELCDEAKKNNKKVLIFSFFLNVIERIKNQLGTDAVDSITGAISSEKRLEIVEEFTNSASKHFLVCQVMAGGLGLNIQAASVVIIAEPQIKPSIEVQAISRSYRMGQLRDVIVYRLLTQESVDEYMVELMNHKQAIFDAYAKQSYLADHSKEAKEIIEVNLIKIIMEKERKRLLIKDALDLEIVVD